MHAEPHPAFLPLAERPAESTAGLVASLGRGRQLAGGEILLREGASSPVLYLVGSGVLVAELSAHSGRRAVVATLGRGDLCGESALGFDPGDEQGSPPVPQVWALVPSRVHALDPALAAGDRRMWTWITGRMLARARSAEALAARALSLPLAERIEWALRDLAEAGLGDRDLRVVTQELLAHMAGASRESVNRALARLASQGRIERRGNRFRVTGAGAGQPGGSAAVSSNRSWSGSEVRATRPSPSSLSR